MTRPRMIDLNDLRLDDLYCELARSGLVRRLFELARDEDLGAPEAPTRGDITSEVSIPADAHAAGAIRARGPGVLAGMAALPDLFKIYRADVALTLNTKDGSPIERGDALAVLEGSLRDLLAIERSALNILSRCSGVATAAAAFVDEVARAAPDSPAAIYDTRKTHPGWRALDKYAVRCGGARCHRIGLYDAVLLKDNHIAGADPDQPLATRVEKMARAARERRGDNLRFIEVEVDALEQFDQILTLEAGLVDIVLLDNMTNDQLRDAVRRRDQRNPALQLEASGGVSLDTVGAIARTGVERISAGMITQSAPALDIGMDL